MSDVAGGPADDLGPVIERFDTGAFTDDLLGRIQARLDADTVAVLLTDRSGSLLVAHAARGLEEEVRQGIRVPIGSGFAGRVASTRRPVVLDDVGPESVVNPILSRRGVTAMLGVPLIHAGRLIGVMHVGRLAPRAFTADDTAYFQNAADRIAAVLNAQQLAAERSAARTLQESLLPTGLPRVPGLEFASRFAAADDFGVGGDWFDVFELPEGGVGIVVGDVAGSGLPAAVVMGRLRSALRAYAIESASPSEALARLDRKFTHFEPDAMATVLYATVAPDAESVTFCSTGHPPPVLAVPDEPAAMVECTPSPPIGAHVASTPVDTTFELAPGTTVGFYTDGLIERRGVPIDDGVERLRESFFAGPPDEVCHAVMSDMIGSDAVHDDTALLVLRRTR
jgi:hypothetical protein